jgi:hypothetical protein
MLVKTVKGQSPFDWAKVANELIAGKFSFNGLFGGIDGGIDPGGGLLHGCLGFFGPGLHGFFRLRSHIGKFLLRGFGASCQSPAKLRPGIGRQEYGGTGS